MFTRSFTRTNTIEVTGSDVDTMAAAAPRSRLLQRSIGNQAVLRAAVPTPDTMARVHHVVRSSGAPLEAGTRAVMEARFDHDLSRIRVHQDARAADAARGVNAHAFTVGPDIVFGSGQYDPSSRRGSELLAHELAHTIQQGHDRNRRNEPLVVSRPSDSAEHEADAAANAVVSNAPAAPLSHSASAIARQIASEEPAPTVFEGVTVRATPSAPARDVPLPDMPEGLTAGVVLAIKRHAEEIIREVTNYFPDTTLILSILTKWFEADERLGSEQRFLRPHLDTLLISLDAHTLNAHTTALDQLWHLFNGRSSREHFQFFLQRSLSYRDYSPGPALRGMFEHEARRADAMRTRVLRRDYASVDRELDEPWAQNRDDVAVELVTYLNDDTLSDMAASVAGRSLLDHLLFEITRGSLGADEARQAKRILDTKTARIPLADVQRALIPGQTKVFPYKETGITVFGAAPLRARRLDDGRIWVNQPMNVRTNPTYDAETATLPLRTFTSGIVLPENEIVAVRLYDQNTTVYGPALLLVQISNQSLTQTLSKIGEVVGLGAGIGIGALVEAGVEATLAARILLWADRVALAFGTLGSAVLEHRGWILKHVPHGRLLIEVVEKINFVIALYGIVRLVAGMPQLVGAWRQQIEDWRAWRAAAREVNSSVDTSLESSARAIDQIDQSLTAEQRARILSTVGRERQGSDLKGPPGSYAVGDLAAARQKKFGPSPEGPQPAAPALAVPEVIEDELRMASGMTQRPTPVSKAKLKLVDSTIAPEATAGSSTPGSSPVATTGSTKPGTLSVVPPAASPSVAAVAPVSKAGPATSAATGPVQATSPGPVIVPMDPEALVLSNYWKSRIAGATNAADKKRWQGFLANITSRGRPAWRQTEMEMEFYYREIGATPEVSYNSNREVMRGTRDSTRPDLVSNALVEVKNYRIANKSNLIAELKRQVSARAAIGPANIRQQVIILDLRGQAVAQTEIVQLASEISGKTGVPVENIQILIW